MNTNTKEKFQKIQNRWRFSKAELVERFDISESTQKNYSTKKTSKAPAGRISGASRSVDIIYSTLAKIEEEHPGVDPKKEFDKLRIRGHRIEEFLRLFNKDKEEHIKITVDLAIEAQLKEQKPESAAEVFRKKYTNINVDTIDQAVAESPDLVRMLIVDDTLKPLTRSHALFSLATGTEEKDSIYDLMMSFIRDRSPFIRESAFMGLYECYYADSEKYSDVKLFFQKSLEQEKADGIRKTLSSFLERM
jgi:hypothetical protein